MGLMRASYWHWFAIITLTYSLTGRATQGNDWQKDWWLVSLNPQQTAPQWWVGEAASAPAKVPIGSLWKLYVYNYSLALDLPDKPYQCHAGRHAKVGDEYCCSQDETITRDIALARSCGAYFEPQRLRIDARQWQQYWQRNVPEIKWLAQLENIQPQTQSSVHDILLSLNRLSANSIKHTRKALLGRILQPQWSALLPHLGGAYRFKTFTWVHPQYKGAYFGGAAGWLADGTAFWVGGTGSSKVVIEKAAPLIAEKLPIKGQSQQGFDEECVAVHYFKRYPIQTVTRVSQRGADSTKVTSGALQGQYAVKFSNGNALQIISDGELSLTQRGNALQLWGKLSMQEYVARVLDREGDATKTEAAKALSIAARSYVYQNAHFHLGCWQIDDDSRKQRVSPNPASVRASQVVGFTEDLSLVGSPIYFHQNQTKPNTLNWQHAVNRAALGDDYLALLHEAYPNASWRLNNQAQQCQRLPQAELYLRQSFPQAKQHLREVKGVEVVQGLKVCQLDYGNPYADQHSTSIYVRDWRSENDRVTLWHEYLHLALRYHPNGHDEALIEQNARRLASQLSLGKYTSSTKRKIRAAQ